jgi:hypothetical protein
MRISRIIIGIIIIIVAFAFALFIEIPGLCNVASATCLAAGNVAWVSQLFFAFLLPSVGAIILANELRPHKEKPARTD